MADETTETKPKSKKGEPTTYDGATEVVRNSVLNALNQAKNVTASASVADPEPIEKIGNLLDDAIEEVTNL